MENNNKNDKLHVIRYRGCQPLSTTKEGKLFKFVIPYDHKCKLTIHVESNNKEPHNACLISIESHSLDMKSFAFQNGFSISKHIGIYKYLKFNAINEVEIIAEKFDHDISVRIIRWSTDTKNIVIKRFDVKFESPKQTHSEAIKWLEHDYFVVGKSSNHTRALDILRNEFKFGSFPITSLPLDSIWSANPFNDRNWQWRLHQLEFSKYLLEAHVATGDTKYISKLEELIKSWVNNNKVEPYPSEFSWHDHSSAIRLNNLIKSWLYFNKMGWNNICSIIEKVSVQHCLFLAQEKFYSKHTNHGFDQSLSLYFGALVFLSWEQQHNLVALALSRIKDELEFAFTVEGVHVENSPGYHAHMLCEIIRIKNIFQFTDILFFNYLNSILESGIDYLIHMNTPNGKISLLGDSEELSLNNLLLKAETKNIEQLKYIMTKGQDGVVPVQKNYIAVNAGYAVYRNTWRFNDLAQIHLILKCGYLSNYHRQDDDLNILLHAYGEDWFIDSGLYKHDHQDEIRDYMRGPFAHNIPIPKGSKTLRKIKQIGVNCKFERHNVNDQAFCVNATTSMFDGFIVKRVVEVTANNEINIIDSVSSGEVSDSSYVTLFHFPKDKVIDNSDKNRIVIKSSLGKSMFIDCTAKGLFEVRVTKGKDKEYPSFTSKKYGELEESYCISFHIESGSSEYRISFD